MITNKPKVQQYSPIAHGGRSAWMQEDDFGGWVRAVNYEVLQADHEEELFRVRHDRDTHFGELMRALEQIDALKAALEGLERVAKVVSDNSDAVCNENNQLRVECEKLRKDAARYQFVRTRVSASNARGPASWAFHYYQLPRPISNPLAGPPAWEHFDDAIDAAMNKPIPQP